MAGMAIEKQNDNNDIGLTIKNFRKIAPNGFGDPHNAYPHSMAWFKNHLYVGTTRANLINRGVGQEREWIGEVWPVKLPESVWDIDLRAQIWRFNPETEEWRKVFTAPWVTGKSGFNVPLSWGFRSMAVYQGKSDTAPALYVPTWATHERPGSVMLRSVDGLNFEIVSEPGFGFGDPLPRVMRGLLVFKDRLFASPAGNPRFREPNTAARMRIMVSSDPAQGEWQEACEPHFGDLNNLTAFQMRIFNDHLYAGTLNLREGFQIWKTDARGDPPFRWTKVISNGAYRGNANEIAMTFCPFRNQLYVGTAIQGGGIDLENKIGPAGAELIRINPDDSWDLIIGEPRNTPEGLKVPLSGLGPGAGNIFVGYYWCMCEHEGYLYLGDAVWSPFFNYAPRKNWPASRHLYLNDKRLEMFMQSRGGCDLWRSPDGVHWTPVTLNGFGNWFNIGVRNMMSLPQGLFVGVANSFGGEVAVKRSAGWVYEPNQKGGLEIWLGNRHYPMHVGTESQKASVPTDAGAGKRVYEVVEKISRPSLEDLRSEFYGNSGFSLVGFWSEGLKGAQLACENLVDELLAFIRSSALYNLRYQDKKTAWHSTRPTGQRETYQIEGKVLDISLGVGSTANCLMKYFPQEQITAVSPDKNEVQALVQKYSGPRFLWMNLPKLNFPDNSFEYVICAERLGNSKRGKLLREIFRVLKPGGVFVGSELLSSTGGKLLALPWARRNKLQCPEDYEAMFAQEGFTEVRIIDATQPGWLSFRAQALRFIDGKILSGEMHENQAQELLALFPGGQEKASQYILFSGKK